MSSLAPQLENLIAFGTDGETALAEALSENFPQAIHLRCFLHFRKNVESKLVSLGLPDHHQYFAEVFGKQEGIAYKKGLLDATSEEDFDRILASLSEPWARREKSETSPFHLWMLERSNLMKSYMIASVRTRAGLGLPPERFYTNDSENTNHPLRHKTRGKELGETAFAKVMKELIEDDQETEFILGVFGGFGQYEFSESFKHLEISKEDWFGMSKTQRKKKVANIYALSIEDTYEPSANQSQGRMFFARRVQ